MNIHEFQVKQLLRDHGVAVLDGDVAHTPQEARAAAAELGGSTWVVKAQIHAGRRGKAGGVAVVRSVGEVAAAADRMLGMRLVTHQTGPAGRFSASRAFQSPARRRCPTRRRRSSTRFAARKGRVLFGL